MTWLLGTNTVSCFLRDHDRGLTERLMACAPDTLAVSVVTVGELRFGLQRLGESRRASVLALRLDKLPQAIPILPLPEQAATHYGRIRHHLQAQGTPIGGNDLWLAAHALAQDLTLVSHNLGEFGRVPGLQVESWLGPAATEEPAPC
ncbi:Ribonuclease VapC1 [Tepidimonas alkaliphilus]|uniref:Ribonuclease VapC n=1 Tax=Tepidimonas alkaliphilus TaxID=2588942 RepID=A0A554WCU1_9BURK|nr:PIN domain-containing protein [Tepidimonas alkaliphilus]TSE21396.1 Ribonuclease VapC1 [Tepidimonas alkaliphilus]